MKGGGLVGVQSRSDLGDIELRCYHTWYYSSLAFMHCEVGRLTAVPAGLDATQLTPLPS